MAQTSATGNLENASREMISTARYTEEHSAPILNLVEKFTLQKGSDTLVIPKVAQMTISDLTEGQDIVDTEEIGMSTVSVTPSEVGGKVIITYKLLRQNSQNIWRVVGRQLGEGMARKKDSDLAALFSALNGGTALGAAGDQFSAAKASRVVAVAKANKYGQNLRAVMHPNQIYRASADLSTVGSAATVSNPIASGASQDQLKDYFRFSISGVNFYEDGNITVDSCGDADGAIFDQGALGILTSVSMMTEREKDISLRAWEMVVTADYIAFEIDDERGAPLEYDANDPSTST